MAFFLPQPHFPTSWPGLWAFVHPTALIHAHMENPTFTRVALLIEKTGDSKDTENSSYRALSTPRIIRALF